MWMPLSLDFFLLILINSYFEYYLALFTFNLLLIKKKSNVQLILKRTIFLYNLFKGINAECNKTILWVKILSTEHKDMITWEVYMQIVIFLEEKYV